MNRTVIPKNVDKYDRNLYLRQLLGERETIRFTIWSLIGSNGIKDIYNKIEWLSLACSIHDTEKTKEYVRDILKVGDWTTQYGNCTLEL